MADRAVFIDGTGLLFQAFFALPSTLATSDGRPTNAAYGFAQMFRKILRGRTPTLGAVVFDAGGSTFRTELDPGYKAQRPRMPHALVQQIEAVEGLVRAHNVEVLKIRGVEADDVLGTLFKAARDAGMEVTLVSGDKDFAQLVEPGVRLFDATNEVFYDADRVRRKWGVRPDQFVDYLALVGDASDNIPGLSGVGKKTAVQALREYGSIDGMLSAADLDPKLRRRLEGGLDRLRLSRKLATIRTDVALPVTLEQLVWTPPTPAQLNAAYRELEFFSLLTAEAPEVGRRPEYFVCDTPEMVQAALTHECQGPAPVGVHIVVEPETREVVGIGLAPRELRGMYVPLAGQGRVLPDLDCLRTWLEDPDRPKVIHEVRTAYVALGALGISLRGVVGDPALASYLVDPTRHLPHHIEQVARASLKRALQPLRGILGRGRDRKRFAELTVDRAGAYACHLADATVGCWRVLSERVREEAQGDVLFEVDLPLARVLAGMQRHGVRIDTAVLDALGEGFRSQRRAVAAEVHRHAGRSFNIGSNKQLGTVLFDELGLEVIKRTKTGYSTAADVLIRLRDRHPIIACVERWRTLDKLLNTYTDVLVRSVNPQTGRIHASFQQTASASGRLITTEPDLQRTPVRSPEFRRVREGFVASEGCQILSADWSQIELRILAHLSQDPMLLEAYQTGADLHTQTAEALFDGPINPERRSVGKTVNFATLYGQGPAALAQQLGIEHRQAKHYIARFFELYAGVARWREEVVTRAYMDGFVSTLGGRIRFIPELATGTTSDRSYGERIAMNTPVQGSAADLCKVAMLTVQRELDAGGFEARMVLQIHDELLFDVPKAEVDAVSTLVRTAMTGAWELSVPLVVDVGVGPTWADAH